MFKGPLDALEIHLPSSAPVSAQLAVVRTLTEEIERHNPAAPYVSELHEQLGEELERLTSLAPSFRCSSSKPLAAPPIDILVVDDDEASRIAAVRVLCELGYSCRTVEDGARALAEYARQPAEIVVSDWSMPGMSGLELTVALKALDDPPYVILATAFHENEQLAGRSGVDDFLRKPIVLEQLEVRLLAASRLVRARRAIAALLAG